MKNAKRQRAIFAAHSTLIVSSILIAAGFLAGRIASLDLINFFLPLLLCVGSIAAIAPFALRRLSMVLLIGATVMATSGHTDARVSVNSGAPGFPVRWAVHPIRCLRGAVYEKIG